MIITQKDIDDLTQFWERHRVDFDKLDDFGYTPGIDSTEYFANHPHLLFHLGYDDYRAILFTEDPRATEKISNLGFGRQFARNYFVFPYESFFRRKKSGDWLWFEGITNYKYEGEKTIDKNSPFYIHFIGADNRDSFHVVNRLIKDLEKAKKNPDPSPHSILLPGIWTPQTQVNQKIFLENVAKELIRAVYLENKELQAYEWQELEEIVAELLSAQGLEILLTPRSKDSGRDVIARGELIPGELSTIAVEVKQKKVVGLHDVQRALKANEDFPSLLVATSGTFSAGVIAEKQRDRHQLRLILKDGIALNQWITIYADRKGWLRRIGS